jgi:hypothetical protein
MPLVLGHGSLNHLRSLNPDVLPLLLGGRFRATCLGCRHLVDGPASSGTAPDQTEDSALGGGLPALVPLPRSGRLIVGRSTGSRIGLPSDERQLHRRWRGWPTAHGRFGRASELGDGVRGDAPRAAIGSRQDSRENPWCPSVSVCAWTRCGQKRPNGGPTRIRGRPDMTPDPGFVGGRYWT